jgi:hypothetical protein
MNAGIKAAYDRAHLAERQRDALIRETYQVGDVVHYRHGNYEVAAEVVGHSGFGDRLLVRGLRSGKEYWISAYRLSA